MSAPLENLSSRNADLSKVIHKLKGVIKRHNGNYLAFCPSHDDRKGRSLAIAVGRENQILMHCFAGCSIHEITSAIGLNLSDLFPCNDNTYITQTRSYLNEWQILEALQFDALVVLISTRRLLTGEILSEEDVNFLAKAVFRINEAVNYSRRCNHD